MCTCSCLKSQSFLKKLQVLNRLFLCLLSALCSLAVSVPNHKPLGNDLTLKSRFLRMFEDGSFDNEAAETLCIVCLPPEEHIS